MAGSVLFTCEPFYMRSIDKKWRGRALDAVNWTAVRSLSAVQSHTIVFPFFFLGSCEIVRHRGTWRRRPGWAHERWHRPSFSYFYWEGRCTLIAQSLVQLVNPYKPHHSNGPTMVKEETRPFECCGLCRLTSWGRLTGLSTAQTHQATALYLLMRLKVEQACWSTRYIHRREMKGRKKSGFLLLSLSPLFFPFHFISSVNVTHSTSSRW